MIDANKNIDDRKMNGASWQDHHFNLSFVLVSLATFQFTDTKLATKHISLFFVLRKRKTFEWKTLPKRPVNIWTCFLYFGYFVILF